MISYSVTDNIKMFKKENDVTIIDDFLPKEYFEQLQYTIGSVYQPWFYQHNITSFDEYSPLGHHGFNYWIVKETNQLTSNQSSQLFSPLLVKMKGLIGSENILRSRLDMTLYTGRSKRCGAHVDSVTPHTNTIFYLNDSDGDTVIYNQVYDPQKDQNHYSIKRWLTVKKRIQPKANRLLAYDGKYIHTGHTPSKHNTRILINSNFN